MAQRGKYNNMTPEDIANKEKKDMEEFKEEMHEKCRKGEPFTRSDELVAALRRWDLRGWKLEWERDKQMNWIPGGGWDSE